MKKILLSALMAVVALTASAQRSDEGTFTLTPQLGFAYSSGFNCSTEITIADSPLFSYQRKGRSGFVAGAELGYQLNSWLRPSVGVLYQYTGYDVTDLVGRQDILDYSHNIHYLNVPILANFYIFHGFAIKAGIQPSFLLGSTYKMEGEKASTTENLNATTFHIPVGVSYEWRNFVVDARVNFALSDAEKEHMTYKILDEVYDIPVLKNGYLQLTLGYKFEL